MADFLFDSIYISPPDRGDVFGEDATIVLLSAAPDPAEATIGDLSGVLDTDTTTTWLASTGVLWAGSLATQPTLDAGGPTAVGYVVALGSGSTAVNVRWVEITPTTSTVQVTASALVTVTDGDVDAPNVGFTPTTGGDWSSSPADVQAALDELGGRSSGGGGSWPDGGGPHSIGSTGLYTVMDRQRVWIGGSPDMTALPLIASGPAPVTIGTIHVDHRPDDPTYFYTGWEMGGAQFGPLLVAVVGATGDLLAMDLSGTLTTSDDARPMLEALSWYAGN